jgi:hypothetical protein
VSLPSSTDYAQAVQQPKVAFLRADLQERSVSRNRLRVPISWSGNFAIVFKLEGPPKPLALRCFTHPVSQTQERYRAYSDFLRGQVPANLRRSLLSLEFLDPGMRVGTRTVPVILMAWQEGDDLLEWVKHHASDLRRLRALQAAFRALVADMEGCAFVHGDLQHGNVLVSAQDHPVLVDYDNLLVPGAKPFGSSNLGLPGFQHPAIHARTDHRLLDRMPALVIHTALEILSVAPGVAPDWGRIDGLVFQARDLADPRRSPLFQALDAHPQLQGFGHHLASALEGPIERVPTLEAFLGAVAAHSFKAPSRWRPTPAAAPPAPSAQARPRPAWTVPTRTGRAGGNAPSPWPIPSASSLRSQPMGRLLAGATALALLLMAGRMGLARLGDTRHPAPHRAASQMTPAPPLRLEDSGPSRRIPCAKGDLHLQPFGILEAPGGAEGGTAEELARQFEPYPIGSAPGSASPEANGDQ